MKNNILIKNIKNHWQLIIIGAILLYLFINVININKKIEGHAQPLILLKGHANLHKLKAENKRDEFREARKIHSEWSQTNGHSNNTPHHFWNKANEPLEFINKSNVFYSNDTTNTLD
jgi:hypothetical protein